MRECRAEGCPHLAADGCECCMQHDEPPVTSGIDTSVCEFCEGPLDDSEPWRRGMDGCGAHERCLKGWL